MRERAAWKLRLLLGLGGLLAFSPAGRAQAPPQSTLKFDAPSVAQMETLGKTTGLGPYHFGMEAEDLPKGDLAPNQKLVHPEPNMDYFLDTNTEKITWGGLHPDRINLQFYYGKLIAIRLHFHEAYGDLLAVNWAVWRKYGGTNGTTFSSFADGSDARGGLWSGGVLDERGALEATIQLRVDLPSQIPAGADEESMARKTDGEMELLDVSLLDKLAQDHHDALEQSVLKSHDLEKIGKDL